MERGTLTLGRLREVCKISMEMVISILEGDEVDK